jgi:hypothetical protein
MAETERRMAIQREKLPLKRESACAKIREKRNKYVGIISIMPPVILS